MEFQEVVRRRRMVRNFEDRPLPPEIVERVVTNAQRAPSAGFSQGWAFLVIEEAGDRKLFWDTVFPVEEREGFTRPGLWNAPLVVVTLSHKQAYLDRYAEPDKGWTDRSESHWPVPYWDIDTGFAALLMLLTAVDEGLGALFFGFHRHDAFRDAFGVPKPYTPIGAVAVGYKAPDEPSPSLKRGWRPIQDVVHRSRW
jgi:nitroreductase